MRNPDPDALLIMGVLMASPNRHDPKALSAAAKAYEAVRSARERGAIPPLTITCPDCGARCAADAMGCPECWAPFDAAPAMPSAPGRPAACGAYRNLTLPTGQEVHVQCYLLPHGPGVGHKGSPRTVNVWVEWADGQEPRITDQRPDRHA